MTGRALGRAAVATVALAGVAAFAVVPAPAGVVAAAGAGMVAALVVVNRGPRTGVVASLRGPVPGAAAVTLGALVGSGLPGGAGWLPALAPLAVVATYALAVWAYPRSAVPSRSRDASP